MSELHKSVEFTEQKMKFSNKGFHSKCDHLVIFTEKILSGKLHLLCNDYI